MSLYTYTIAISGNLVSAHVIISLNLVTSHFCN